MFEAKDIRLQMLEIKGEQEFEKGLYHNEEYESLMKGLKESRQEYEGTRDVEQRKALSQH